MSELDLDALEKAAKLFSEKLTVSYHLFSSGPDEHLSAFLMDGDEDDGSIICVDEDPDPYLDELPSPRLHAIADIVNALPALIKRIREMEEEISTWCSVFPDIAPHNVLPDRSKLEARVKELEALTQWQPIETAPRDIEVLVCFVSDYGWQEKPSIYGPVTAKFNGKEWVSSWDDERVICSETWAGTEYKDVEFEPTHWMPLPEAPAQGGESDG